MDQMHMPMPMQSLREMESREFRPHDDTYLHGRIHDHVGQFDRRHGEIRTELMREWLRKEMEKETKREIKKDQLRPGDHIYTWRAGGLYAHHGIYMGDDRVVHFTGSLSAGQASSLGVAMLSLLVLVPGVFALPFIITVVASGGTILPFSLLGVAAVQSSMIAVGLAKGSAGRQSSLASSSSSRSQCSTCGRLEYSDRIHGVIFTCLDCFLHSGGIWRYDYGISETDYKERRRGTCNTAEPSPVEVVLLRAEGLLMSNGFGEYDLFTNNCEDFATFCKTGQPCDRNGTAPNRYGQAANYPNGFRRARP